MIFSAGDGPRALCTPSKYSIIELHAQPTMPELQRLISSLHPHMVHIIVRVRDYQGSNKYSLWPDPVPIPGLIVEAQGHVWTKPKLKKPKGLQEGFLEKPWESWQREESRWTAGWVHECLLCRRVCMKALMNQRPLNGHPDVILEAGAEAWEVEWGAWSCPAVKTVGPCLRLRTLTQSPQGTTASCRVIRCSKHLKRGRKNPGLGQQLSG